MSPKMEYMADQPHDQITARQLCELLYRIFMFGAVELARLLGKPRPRSD